MRVEPEADVWTVLWTDVCSDGGKATLAIGDRSVSLNNRP